MKDLPEQPRAKELILLPDGVQIYAEVPDYAFDELAGRYCVKFEHKGAMYNIMYYNNFWAVIE